MATVSRTTIILGVLVVGIAGGIFASIYAAGFSMTATGDDNLQKSAHDGSFSASNSLFSPQINKEQWHQDPFASLAQQVKDGQNHS